MARACLSYESATKWNELTIDLRKLKISALRDDTIGHKIRYHRLEKGWSQYELAKKIGLSENQGRYLIKDYETRGLHPSREISIKLAEIFNLESKYFYDDYFEFLDNSINIITGLRNKYNLSKTKIAKTIGVTRETWTRWENGYIISRENYEKIKELLKY